MRHAVLKHIDRHKLLDAIESNMHITCQRAQDDQTLNSRLLRLDDNGLLIDAPIGFDGAAEVIPDEMLEVTLRFGRETLRFVSRVIAATPHRINAETVVQALLLTEPQEIRVVQRRDAYRVMLVDQDSIDVTIWTVEVKPDKKQAKPQILGEFHGRLFDVSAGGINVLMKDDSLAGAASGRQLWARFKLPDNDENLTFHVEFRHQRLIESSGLYSCGLKFLEYARPGEQAAIDEKLARFVAQRQREQLSRRRDK